MGMRKETEREAGRPGTRIARPLPSPVTRLRGHRDRLAVAIAMGAALGFAPVAAAETKPRPCAAHPVQAAPGKVSRAVCLRAYKRQRARDRMQFPPSPTRRDVEKRVPDWQGFVRLGRCEQPGPSKYGDGVRWDHPGPTWGGGVGLYRRTWQAAGSPYRTFSGDKWETILVADAVRDRFGITAWGAWRCFR
jgi:hypothetical protein